MFEKDVSGFTEDFDPNAEPGDIGGEAAAADDAPAVPAEATSDESDADA
jgi:large subunit ribosomal protein L9